GKTEVYLRTAETVLAREKQVVVLVPEIALTPQLTGRFRSRFGDRIAVLHSGLTPPQRLREWRRIRAEEAGIVVGARSALFAPFRRLGLIIVDEEHDASYKQDDGVRYNARDLAVVRGHLEGCPVVLGSATPSLESWQNAQLDRYTRLKLPSRATPRPVPEIRVLDRRQPTRSREQASGAADAGDPGIFAPEVASALEAVIQSQGKAIVLYNRRGFAPVVQCSGCGGHYTCPTCGVGMVYHQRRARVNCHYCGFYRHFRDLCPECGGTIELLGHGTERVEMALTSLLEGVNIARMDADTTASRGSHQRILDGFRKGDTQVLVGTQMVAKGHDFPNVHLAIVLGVDHLLGMPDFRCAERTFSLVTQLAGRRSEE
ncbi:MAG: primosomal protein N', partial [Myxococcota bacterium]|nr:primosomal protein N' [Myxococcota bacterium]